MLEKQLAQARESGTSTVSVYSPAEDQRVVITSIILANTSGADCTFRLFCDDDGSTYDETTALAWDITLAANTSVQLTWKIAMDDSAGNFAYQTSVADAITITLFGFEV